jgi:hypothetical protein
MKSGTYQVYWGERGGSNPGFARKVVAGVLQQGTLWWKDWWKEGGGAVSVKAKAATGAQRSAGRAVRLRRRSRRHAWVCGLSTTPGARSCFRRPCPDRFRRWR